MLLRTRTLLAAVVFPLTLAALPGCQSCAGTDDKQEPPATKPGEMPQMRGLQKVRLARPDLLREAGIAAPAHTGD